MLSVESKIIEASMLISVEVRIEFSRVARTSSGESFSSMMEEVLKALAKLAHELTAVLILFVHSDSIYEDTTEL
jgi:hypothetical protein